uniref:Uncharacterized protein n=1 Tax=Leptocylindrus danicus TaxID=163516 RepID=A0A7S2NXB7_9STRA|mmetsp:Transcript_15956/g.23512  ORF Transcript_15956/g.23512 Transcript_15956/m.23512 type:complete len:119 (+) Transcript_15956:3-359(+)
MRGIRMYHNVDHRGSSRSSEGRAVSSTGAGGGSDGVELFTMEPMLPESPCACDKNLTWVSRSDDTEEIVAKRLADFHVESKSILDFYESRDKLIRFVPYLGVDDLPKLVDVIRDKLVQ